MSRKYSQKEREISIDLAVKIGTVEAARQLGVNKNTLYSWQRQQKKQQSKLDEGLKGKNKTELLQEVVQLRNQLRQAQQNVKILQKALSFYVESGKRWTDR